ncbi:quinol dehydrogenase ferredoxin subunit NapH [Sansalvadorimonas sp. 2012CJ34-2]|uniref:Quinol dehydrogenase ferredoxin subunit NapH n=1 Tax=Parendozoicomonas callyspongiae TaxID=2942213 RepID=A0ABT0PC10_9GAMM|nr:quinol dehydrogenase ferredoxin subunit NapH [Sansalvadorimonas sp. 2012CJ34-2]MCL6268917.1 quinol dehydrogenase ferredoxin subunit NapH [Sansalvadorimonas sp. 2012CJ34-2]
MSKQKRNPGQEASETLGWWHAHRFMILRRLSQITVLALFLLTPWLGANWLGIHLIDGNLSSSRILDTVPMTDPLLALQTLAALHPLRLTAAAGALLVAGLYWLIGGRTFCSWVCPINPVTDLAGVLRRKLDIRTSHRLPRTARYWLLGLVLVLPLVTGVLAWEIVNPVSQVYRGLLFGMGSGWMLIVAIFLFDLLVSQRGWCGHLCPLGAFYSLIGKASPVKVNASRREQCDDCMDCYAVCPEPQILPIALKPAKGGGPVLNPSVLNKRDCTRCGRCIDVCAKQVFDFQMNIKFSRQAPDTSRATKRSLAK